MAIFAPMKPFKAILLLFILGTTLVPWQLLCTTHLFGHHHHHEHDGPSPCELHRIAAQQAGEDLLPPMECAHISDATYDYNEVRAERTASPLQWVAVAVVFVDAAGFQPAAPPFLKPPDPRCRSATLLSDSPLRAPPLV